MMVFFILTFFVLDTFFTGWNAAQFYKHRRPANLGAAIVCGIASLMMIAQYMVIGLR